LNDTRQRERYPVNAGNVLDENWDLEWDQEIGGDRILENDWIGDEMKMEKNRKRTRMIFHNCNGIKLRTRTGFGDTCIAVKQMETEMYHVQEHNLDTTQQKIIQQLTKTAKQAMGQVKMEAGSSSKKAKNNYKPGGTMTITEGRLLGRVIASESDYLGRWEKTTLSGKQGKIITVYNTYIVGKRDHNELGEMTVARQMDATYMMEGRVNENPRSAHISDLTIAMDEDKKKGHNIILGGDFNESMNNESIVNEIMATYDLIDPIGAFHDTTGGNSYNRGSKIIDYVLISRSLLTAVSRCGYMPYNEILEGDHRAAYVDFDT